MKLTTKAISFLLLLLTNTWLYGQVTEEKILEQISHIGKSISENEGQLIDKEIEQFKVLIKTIPKEEKQLKAVAYAKVGHQLSDKNYVLEATYFYEQALKYRQKAGEYVPIRWALKSLYQNSLDKEDFKSAADYTYQWAKLWKENIETEAWKKAYSTDYWNYKTSQQAFAEDYFQRIEEVGNFGYRKPMEKSKKERDKRCKYAAEMTEHYLEKYNSLYPMFPSEGEILIPFYRDIILKYFKAGNTKKGRYWEKKTLKILSKYRSGQEVAGHIRHLMTIYRNGVSVEESVRASALYAKANEKIKQFDQMGFAYRYAGLTYLEKHRYVESIRAFAEAIKMNRKYGLEKDVIQSYGGVDRAVNQLAKYQDSTALLACQQWKEGYSLKGLSGEDIAVIDAKVNYLSFEWYLDMTYNEYSDRKEFGGVIFKGKRHGKWTWWSRWTGKVEKEITYKDGKLDGVSIHYYGNGNKQKELFYVEGKAEGLQRIYYENGVLGFKSNFKEGKKDGKAFYYTEKGELKKIEIWENGTLIETNNNPTSEG